MRRTVDTPSSILPVSAALVLLCGASYSQGLQFTWPGPYGQNSVAGVGDVDGDGVADFAVGEPGVGDAVGFVRVRSGATGADLFAVAGAGAGDRFGWALVGLGDVDQDGRADFAASAIASGPSGQPPYVRVLSGATAQVLWQVDVSHGTAWWTAQSLARLSDLDGDGVDELVIGSTGEVLVLSGTSGALLHRISPPAGSSSSFGLRVARAGDHDQDGFEDILVADPQANGGQGRVTIHSGRSGGVLMAIDGAGGNFGQSLVSVPDLDGDGVPEVLVGSPSELLDPGGASYGRVRLFSGADGSVLLTLEGGGNLRDYGESVAVLPDLDGDGLPDLLVARGTHWHGTSLTTSNIYYYSSVSGAVLGVGGRSSRGITVVPDANGDGLDDYLNPRGASVSQGAAALVLTNTPPPWGSWLCPAKITSQGCRPAIGFEGAPSARIGDPFSLSAVGLVPGQLGLFWWSSGLNFTATPFAGGTLCLAPPLNRFAVLTTSPSGSHSTCPFVTSASMTLTLTKTDLAAMGLQPGEQFMVQGVFRDPGFAPPNDLGLTNSLVIHLWP